ncbi:MAG: dTDP-4-dehydrorhamnose 3,5-epimerase [Verrucomicrobiaceae bacterium]|nr:dTDP-4-dehydrorhamnose 3,5-epimerase [Verrucomicrobiaceae bacterium]
MKFTAASIPGVWIIEPDRHMDERGWFARTWCEKEFEAYGLPSRFVQCSASFNHRLGTLRGMHYQAAPCQEEKLIRCTRGAMFDVALDLREESPMFRQWIGIELSADNGSAIFIPKGVAHGFQTLLDNTEVHYSITTEFNPSSARTASWNDPAFSIAWPMPEPANISHRDATAPWLESL